MRFTIAILFGLFLALPCGRADDQLVVISMRQYLISGSSRIHLYLYAMDGTFKKALTDDNKFNDLNPVFSDDGKSVRFEREAADKPHQARREAYVVDIASGAIRPCDPGKDDFRKTFCDKFGYSYAPESPGWINVDKGFYQSPDGKFLLRRKPVTNENESPSYEVAPQGKEARLIGEQPGFLSVNEISPYDSPLVCNGSPFVTDRSDMELIFFSHHIDSTTGDEIWALDLTVMQGAKISDNAATVFHPPSASGVFVTAQKRYQPLGDTGKTVNCRYLEWWDARLKQVRYGPDLSVCYSAAIYGGEVDTNVVIPGNN